MEQRAKKNEARLGWVRRVAPLGLVAVVCATALPAEARRTGIPFGSHGEELFEVADFPAEMRAQIEIPAEMRVGYKCHHVALFWSDLLTWDCQLVGMAGADRYVDLPPDLAQRLAADPRFGMSQAHRGVWNQFGIWLLGGVVVVAVAVNVYRQKRQARAAGAGWPAG